MFQFTKERIINSVLYDGLDVFQAGTDVLRVIPGDNFYKDSKLGKTSKITKTAYEAPVYEKLVAKVPLKEMSNYCMSLSSITGGRASFIMSFASYELVPMDVQDKVMKDFEAQSEKED